MGRSQTVVLNGNSSDELQVLSGVPQGSFLGPILFLLYINDLPDSLQSQVRLFAAGMKRVQRKSTRVSTEY